MTRGLLVLLAAAPLLLVAACSGSEDGGRYSSLLRLVPDDPEFRASIVVVDFEAIRALPGYEASRPLGQTDGEAASDPFALAKAVGWHGIPAVPLDLLGFDRETLPEALPLLEDGFGITLPDIDRALTVALFPPHSLQIAAGDLDPDSIDAALEACEACAPGEQVDHAGLTYWNWGGANQQLAKRLTLPAIDVLGRGSLFRFADGYVVRANFAEDLEASLDASLGTGSLLGNDAFRLLAENVDERELVAIRLGDEEYDRAFAQRLLEGANDFMMQSGFGAVWDIPDDAILPTSYDAFATAVGLEDGEPYTLVLLAYTTADEAEQNVDRFNQRLAEGIALPGETFEDLLTSTEVTTDGRLLIATLRGRALFTVTRFFPDPLLLHE